MGWSPVFPHSKSLPVGSFLWSSLFPVAMAYPSLPGPSALPHHWCHHPAIEVPPREGAMSHQMSLSTDTNYLLRAWCWALQGHSPRVGGHPLFPWCQQSVSPILCPTHTPKLWQCPGSSNAVLCMHTGALSGASVQPRLATCGSRAVLVWRSLVSIKSSSRARQPRMVQAHTPSPSLPPSFSPGLTGTHGRWRPSVPARYQAGSCVCSWLMGTLVPCHLPPASTHGGDRWTDRETDAGWACCCFQRGSRTHTGLGGEFEGRD